MENSELMLALLVGIFVILALIAIRQGELMTAVRTVLARTKGMTTELENEINSKILALIDQGRRREAIRLYRKSYGASLADAATAVEDVSRRKES